MQFVPSAYHSDRQSAIEVWHHLEEAAEVVATLAAHVGDVSAALQCELDHPLSCALHLCVYRTSDDAAAALGRNVPTTMLMAPRIGPDWSLIICQSSQVDPRNGEWSRMRRHLAHEVAHVMLADFTGSTRILGDGGRSMRVRTWFDEGFAELAAAVVCARQDIVAGYLAAGSKAPWSEEELDAALNDIASPRRPAAFAEAVSRVQVLCRGGTLRDVIHNATALAPISLPYNTS
jgi:hypothetical protein